MAVMALLRFEPGVTRFQIVGLHAEVAQEIADYLGKHTIGINCWGSVFIRNSALIVVHRYHPCWQRRWFAYEQAGVVARQSEA